MSESEMNSFEFRLKKQEEMRKLLEVSFLYKKPIFA